MFASELRIATLTISFLIYSVKKNSARSRKRKRSRMDNAKIHLGKRIRELIEKAGAKLIYLSPYSPEFSPIENFWSKVKENLRKVKARNYKDLINAITDSMLKVTKNDIRNWFVTRS